MKKQEAVAFRSQNCMITYTIWRFVKLPMLEERVPDRFWLGVPLKQRQYPRTQKNLHCFFFFPLIFMNQNLQTETVVRLTVQ